MPRTVRRQVYSDDARELPTYGITEAARYLGLPVATLRSWTMGRRYPTADGVRTWQPLIRLPDKKGRELSFMNLVEASALATIRRRHKIRMPAVRKAIDYLNRGLNSSHPLAERLETDGLDLFIQKYGQLINLSQLGQLGIKECLQAHLQRVEHDPQGLAVRLFPWTRGDQLESPKIIAIDPLISFGKPTLLGTGIRTEVLASRLRAGDTLAELRDDYGLAEEQVEEAIRYELLAA
jgi:uncharacterized protein (DUF433 family)